MFNLTKKKLVCYTTAILLNSVVIVSLATPARIPVCTKLQTMLTSKLSELTCATIEAGDNSALKCSAAKKLSGFKQGKIENKAGCTFKTARNFSCPCRLVAINDRNKK